ncbi:MAG TPA: DNA gyrase inhibitor YacG [Acidobacteriaceae bacterium]|nr:DNA gyrase inhibitor YacG [Acidobacteriaceae bacterium]
MTTKILRCPTCRTIVTQQEENFPFCSDRCRVIDLGKWASGAYRISSPVLDPEVLEGLGDLPQPHGEHDEED